MVPDPVLSLRSFNHEFTRFEKKHDPWSDLTNNNIPINSMGEEPYFLKNNGFGLFLEFIQAI